MTESTDLHRAAQIVYLSHGGGPLPILGDPGHRAMVAFMKRLPAQLKKPDAVLFISAHWEEPTATFIGAKNPPLLFDYYGFPEQAYRVTYPAPGNPELTERIVTILKKNQIPTQMDNHRGFDHGVFIPMMLMYPEANIPVAQISLLRGLSPERHLALGRAMRELVSENILVVGSGFSFHNQYAFFQSRSGSDPKNEAFQDWLMDTCTGPYTEQEREQRLRDWEKAPNARYCHPREEHLLPLHVCQAMADEPAEVVFNDQILGKHGVAFLWS